MGFVGKEAGLGNFFGGIGIGLEPEELPSGEKSYLNENKLRFFFGRFFGLRINICIYIYISIHKYIYIYIYNISINFTHIHTHTSYIAYIPSINDV